MKLVIHIIVLSLILNVVIIRPARGDLVVNEVLSNEPGTSITLEWFELFKSGSTSENLGFYQIQVGATILTLDTSGPIVLPAGEYLVICRNLFSINNS